jgi:hypothetical protein
LYKVWTSCAKGETSLDIVLDILLPSQTRCLSIPSKMRYSTLLALAGSALAMPAADPRPVPTAAAEPMAFPVAAPEPTAAPEPQLGLGVT